VISQKVQLVQSKIIQAILPDFSPFEKAERQHHSHEKDRIADHMHNGVDSIAMCVRVIAELAMEIVSHANLRGAHAVLLPNVLAAVTDCTNGRRGRPSKIGPAGRYFPAAHCKLQLNVRRTPRQSPW